MWENRSVFLSLLWIYSPTYAGVMGNGMIQTAQKLLKDVFGSENNYQEITGKKKVKISEHISSNMP